MDRTHIMVDSSSESDSDSTVLVSQNVRESLSNEKKILGSKYLLLKHDNSAQNEGKHVLG